MLNATDTQLAALHLDRAVFATLNETIQASLLASADATIAALAAASKTFGKVTVKPCYERDEAGKLTTKLSGTIGVYGLGKYPLATFPDAWLKVLDLADEIRAMCARTDIRAAADARKLAHKAAQAGQATEAPESKPATLPQPTIVKAADKAAREAAFQARHASKPENVPALAGGTF